MVRLLPDKQEVLALLDIIDGDTAPLDSKISAIKRLEYILGRPILNTKEFKRIKDEFTTGAEESRGEAVTIPFKAPEKPKVARTKRGGYTPTGGRRVS